MPTKTLRVETVAQAYLELLRDRGIDFFFANAGTDFASIVDAFARFARPRGRRPRARSRCRTSSSPCRWPTATSWSRGGPRP